MEEKYWNNYYTKAVDRAAPTIPSQFAAFVANEFRQLDPFVIDVGCGNGRDTRFFAQSGFNALGVDASESAIENCQKTAKGIENISFVCAALGEGDLAAQFAERAGDLPVLLYARFFLHAIQNSDEMHFFDLADQICGKRGVIAVEFRTEKDEALAKVTDSHFRRFINPIDFLERAMARGFHSTYFSEGFGFAKFRNDDAHVARLFLTKPAMKSDD